MKNGKGFEGSNRPLADCCYDAAKGNYNFFDNFSFLKILSFTAEICDENNRNIWKCCSPQNKCGHMQGCKWF